MIRGNEKYYSTEEVLNMFAVITTQEREFVKEWILCEIQDELVSEGLIIQLITAKTLLFFWSENAIERVMSRLSEEPYYGYTRLQKWLQECLSSGDEDLVEEYMKKYQPTFKLT